MLEIQSFPLQACSFVIHKMLQTLNFPISGLHSPAYIEMLQTLKFPISSMHPPTYIKVLQTLNFPISSLHSTQPHTYIYEMFAILFCFCAPSSSTHPPNK